MARIDLPDRETDEGWRYVTPEQRRAQVEWALVRDIERFLGQPQPYDARTLDSLLRLSAA